mmetsp:Transcript_8525/g.16517  ORF Transcript_8525/g.16517 Transcript_8525/m.16517 type:complete len:169 (-) Transcript_8525:109-615(-)
MSAPRGKFAGSYRPGVLIGNWGEDLAGGDVFKQPQQPDMYETTTKNSFLNSGSEACVENLKSRNDPLPTAAHCVEKQILFTHKGDQTNYRLRINRGLLAKKTEDWAQDAKSNSRGGGFRTTNKMTFTKQTLAKPKIVGPPKSADNVFPADINKSERFKTTMSASYAKP